MQGRLVPPTPGQFQCFPRDNWQQEFKLAAGAELDCIEWIYDRHGADVNPLAHDAGIRSMQALSTKCGVSVRSLCADYFMERPLVRATAVELEERLQTLSWLLERCGHCGIGRIVLPFVDASRIESDAELLSLSGALERALQGAEQSGVEIHLETSLNPQRFAVLLDRLRHSMLKVNYDSGNSAALGYDPRDEFAAYGARVGSVHIKDRVRGGGTVPLGTGDTDFAALFHCLRSIDYAGDLILQVARDAPGDEVSWARRNRAFVTGWLRGMAQPRSVG